MQNGTVPAIADLLRASSASPGTDRSQRERESVTMENVSRHEAPAVTLVAWNPNPGPSMGHFDELDGYRVVVLDSLPEREKPAQRATRNPVFTGPGLYILDRPERPAVCVTARAGFESASEGQLYTFTLDDLSEPPFYVFAKHLNAFLIERLDTREN